MSMDASLALIAAGWSAGWILAGRDRALPPCPQGEAITVSVIVPARNEEGSLPHLLARLASASPAPTEVLVVDDGSCDATAALAAAAGWRVLTVDPPEGWTGKAWACWQGAQAARGDVLVFLDADTEPGSGFVADLASAAIGVGGLVSVAAFLEVVVVVAGCVVGGGIGAGFVVGG
jgi:4,4'-diaponeurosporenoate glycosyltransferase